jgi:hypothetical protein
MTPAAAAAFLLQARAHSVFKSWQPIGNNEFVQSIMAAPPLSSLLLTPEERAILERANASFTGNIEKCFNVSFSTSERQRFQHHCTASPVFVPSDPSSLSASEFNAKEHELNRTKGRLDVLDMGVWTQAVNRYKLTGSINADVRRQVPVPAQPNF